MQPLKSLKGVPPAAVFTCEFDPLRDVGVEYALKLDEADNEVKWLHFDTLTHSFLQMALWSHEAMATTNVGQETKRLANSSGRKCNAKNMAEVDLLSKIRAVESSFDSCSIRAVWKNCLLIIHIPVHKNNFSESPPSWLIFHIHPIA